MRQQLRDEMARAVYTVLNRNTNPDKVVISEKVMNAVELIYDMNSGEEEGINAVPGELGKSPTWDAGEMKTQATKPAPLPHKAISPAITEPEAGCLVQVVREADLDREIKAREKRRPVTPISFRGAAVSPEDVGNKKHWEPGDLMQAIIQNTPESISFTPLGLEDKEVVLTAVRNVQNQEGTGNIFLTYKHPRIAEADAPGKIDLIARVSFSLYSKEQDVEKAIASITAQLKGLYKPREEIMEPHSGPDPGPLRERGITFDHASLPMGDSHGERMVSGLRPSQRAYADRQDDEILRDSLRRVHDSNRSLTPPDKRL